MSKGLEALRELRENGAVSFSKATISFTYLAFVQRADIIEKELKEHEQHKAIEEKMKMPIDKFFKALGCKNIVCWEYWKDKPKELIGGTVINVSGCCTDENTFGFEIHTSKGELYTYWSYDYGKTWALTKEELVK